MNTLTSPHKLASAIMLLALALTALTSAGQAADRVTLSADTQDTADTAITMDGDSLLFGVKWWVSPDRNYLAAAASTLLFGDITSNDILPARGRITRASLTPEQSIFAVTGDFKAINGSSGHLFVAAENITGNNISTRNIIATSRNIALSRTRIEGSFVATARETSLDAASAVAGNVWIQSENFDIAADVEGGLTAQGQHVRIFGRVGLDAALSAGRIDIGPDADIGGALIADGRKIVISGVATGGVTAVGETVVLKDATAKRDVIISGEGVLIDPTSEITGNVIVIAGTTDLSGRVGGDATLSGGNVRINGRVQGDVDVRAQHLEIGPDAHIAGALVHDVETVSISPGADISEPVMAANTQHALRQSDVLLSLMALGAAAVLLLLPGGIILTALIALFAPNLLVRHRTASPGEIEHNI